MVSSKKQLLILGICICDRVKESGKVQQTLTKFGHIIKTRYGFHEVTEDVCSRNGFIILELAGDMEEWTKLENELQEIGGIDLKKMNFILN